MVHRINRRFLVKHVFSFPLIEHCFSYDTVKLRSIILNKQYDMVMRLCFKAFCIVQLLEYCASVPF